VCCSNKGEVLVRVSWWHTSSCAIDSAVQLQMHKTQPNGVKGREFGTSLHVMCEMCCVHRMTPCPNVMVLCSAAQLPGWVLDAGDLVLPRPTRDPCVVWSHVRCRWDVVTARSDVTCHAGGTMGSSGYPVVQVGWLELCQWERPQTLYCMLKSSCFVSHVVQIFGITVDYEGLCLNCVSREWMQHPFWTGRAPDEC